LAAQHDDLVVFRDSGCGTNDVLELCSSHRLLQRASTSR
jgi:hypothetical protein